MATVTFSIARRNVMIVSAEGRLLSPVLLSGSVYRLASDDGAKNVNGAAEFNTAVTDLIAAGQLKKNTSTGKVELTTAGRATLTGWAGRAY